MNMKKKEFAVGETFQFGLSKLKVIELKDRSSCYDCILFELCENASPICVIDFVGECKQQDRADKKNVMFVEVEEEG